MLHEIQALCVNLQVRMPKITLPRGQSLRQVAGRLGVSVQALNQHAQVQDVEAPMPMDRFVEIPDDLLKERRRKPVDPAIGQPVRGMNSWLALDVERKRVALSGNQARGQATSEEEEALQEARDAYLRFEPLSNDLAIDLYGQLTASPRATVRAQAFAGQALGYAQRHLLFGAAALQAYDQGVSAVRAAQMADPRLAQAHLAQALVLQLAPASVTSANILDVFERSISLDNRDPWAWAEMSRYVYNDNGVTQKNTPDRATSNNETQNIVRQSIAIALELDPQCVTALVIAAELAFDAHDFSQGDVLFEQAIAVVPTFINARVYQARRWRQQRPEKAERLLALALENVEDPLYRAYLDDLYECPRPG
ncbi:MAG: hypothetical protein R3C68_11000 [Myxococcota bacterium]